MMAHRAVDFSALFSGRSDAYGTGVGRVIREPLGIEQYAEHLRGDGPGLGVFPLSDTGTVRFAAIDLDRPDFETARAMAELLPGQAWIEQSRSGNAHVWVFFNGAVEAWVVRGVLRAATSAVGEPTVELFPKQDKLLAGMVGNYINLPLHGENRPIVWGDGAPNLAIYSPDDFIHAALATRNKPDAWRRRAEALRVPSPDQLAASREREFGTDTHLHVCAEYMVAGALSGERPITAGHRSVVYFNLAKQLLMWSSMDEDQAWDLVVEVEAASPDRISQRELRRLFNNAASGRWTSYGCDDPVMAPYVSPTCPIAGHNH